jgi:hypothetical protein
MNSNNQNPDRDTLQETFDRFFGPTEETGGTGYVRRVIDGEIHEVLVDADEAAEFEAQRAAEAAARIEHQRKLDELMQVLNS